MDPFEPPESAARELDPATQRTLLAELIAELAREQATGVPTIIQASRASISVDDLLRAIK